ncbi:hypothetical protein FMK94_06880 [Klebsiella grimontii]|nr:hypothetical protein [Klebsiella michiganensis]MBX4826758.1 hypothetical protein [Klebsiella grimontii]MBZ7272155.1 hypothetical protein [Klebsiella grimontii]MBZ7513995.1 hypothetical protein [Klebsiella grimontii]TYF94938.1 hypothetical protein DJ542_06415 [Klebsiella grimontii]
MTASNRAIKEGWRGNLPALFFLPQHNGKTQSCPETKASSAAKNHTPDDGKYTISLYVLVFMTICW